MTDVEYAKYMIGQLRTALATQSGYSSAELTTASGSTSKYANWEPAKLRQELKVWEQNLRDAEAKEAGTLSPRIRIMNYERGS